MAQHSNQKASHNRSLEDAMSTVRSVRALRALLEQQFAGADFWLANTPETLTITWELDVAVQEVELFIKNSFPDFPKKLVFNRFIPPYHARSVMRRVVDGDAVKMRSHTLMLNDNEENAMNVADKELTVLRYSLGAKNNADDVLGHELVLEKYRDVVTVRTAR